MYEEEIEDKKYVESKKDFISDITKKEESCSRNQASAIIKNTSIDKDKIQDQ